MKTFARNDRSRERGVTLFETLVTLSILSLAAGIVGAAITTRAPRLIVYRAVDALVVDLKRARLLAQSSGEPLLIQTTPDGYRIERLQIERTYASGLTVVWNEQETAELPIAIGLEQPAISIRFHKADVEATVIVTTLSGRIARAN